MKLRQKSFYAALVLVVLGVLSSLILAGVNLVTKVDEAEQFQEKVAKFYPEAEVSETLVVSGFKNGEFTEILNAVKTTDGALAVRVKSKKAYSADGLELLVFFMDKTVVRVEKYGASETPGIGSKVVSKEHLQKYVGRSAEEFADREALGGTVVDGVTGATRTSTGVNLAMTAAANFCLWEAAR